MFALFFHNFGPNTTTFVYPAEIFPVRVRSQLSADARFALGLLDLVSEIAL